VKRFLIINPFGIGDVLFSTPVIRSIKVYDPTAFIGYWCNERVRDVLKDNPRIDKIFALSRGDIKKIFQRSKIEGLRRSLGLFFGIKKEKFDVCLDYSLDNRYGLTAKLAGIKRRVGFDYKKRGMFLTDKMPLAGYNDKHVVEYYFDLLKPLGISSVAGGLELPVKDATAIKAKNIFSRINKGHKGPVIGILAAGGASWGKDARLKHWPAIKFTHLIDEISEKFGALTILLGDALERPVAEAVAMSAKHKPVDLVGKMTLEELIAVIKDLDLLVTNDGGALHIAAALGVKTVSIFGPTDSRVYGPYPSDPKRHIVLKSAEDCSPCYRNFRYPPCQKNICLEDIGVNEVMDAVSLLLIAKGN